MSELVEAFTETEMFHLKAILSDIFWRMEPIEIGPGVSVHPPIDVVVLLDIFEKKIERLKEKEGALDPSVWPSLRQEYADKVLISKKEYDRLTKGEVVDIG